MKHSKQNYCGYRNIGILSACEQITVNSWILQQKLNLLICCIKVQHFKDKNLHTENIISINLKQAIQVMLKQPSYVIT